MDFKSFSVAQKNSSQELYGFLPESATKTSAANPLTTLTPISERTFIDENSCNAVDIPLAGQVALQETVTIRKELSQFLCFNGQFQKSTIATDEINKEENGVDFLLNVSAEAPENTFVDQMTEDEGDGGGKVILSAAKKVTFEESLRSPDLFGEDEDDEQDEEEKPAPITEEPTIPEEQEPELNDSSEIENCNFIQKREKQVYRRMKSSLSGVLPPPSVINANSNLMEAFYSKRADILESITKLGTLKSTTQNDINEEQFLFKPSHCKEQVDKLRWGDIQNVNYHGIQ